MRQIEIDIKHLIGKDIHGKQQQVQFQYFRRGYFFYGVQDVSSGKFYTFPVPLSDIGIATMNRQDKAITFMRWIRKALDSGKLIEQHVEGKGQSKDSLQ